MTVNVRIYFVKQNRQPQKNTSLKLSVWIKHGNLSSISLSSKRLYFSDSIYCLPYLDKGNEQIKDVCDNSGNNTTDGV